MWANRVNAALSLQPASSPPLPRERAGAREVQTEHEIHLETRAPVCAHLVTLIRGTLTLGV